MPNYRWMHRLCRWMLGIGVVVLVVSGCQAHEVIDRTVHTYPIDVYVQTADGHPVGGAEITYTEQAGSVVFLHELDGQTQSTGHARFNVRIQGMQTDVRVTAPGYQSA